jgi:ABC-2 type transport system permease protein
MRSLTWLGVAVPGSAVPLAVVAVLDAVLGMARGLFASAFARTEFQAGPRSPALAAYGHTGAGDGATA